MKTIDHIVNSIKEHENFVILAHKKPDGDAIGSSLALCRLLHMLGKRAYIIQHDRFSFNLFFLKNDCFKETVSYEPDVVICLDSADLSRVEDRMIYKNALLVNIDHHATNTMYGDINYVDSNASSTGEIIYRLCKQFDTFSEEIYRGLYVAIATDTNRFYYSNTSVNTMEVVYDIYQNLDNIYDINKELYGTVPLAKLKLGARAIEKAEFYFNNKVAITTLSTAEQEQIGSTDTDDIVESLRDIEGVEVSILLYNYKGELKVSLRSKEYVDVSEIAKRFGGGGHKRASGISLGNEDMDKFKQSILEAIRECME